MKNKKLVVSIILAFAFFCVECTCGELQNFTTDLGKIQISVPEKVSLSSKSNGTNLYLLTYLLPSFETRLVDILLKSNTHVQDFNSFVASIIPPSYKKAVTSTDDGHKMLFCSKKRTVYVDKAFSDNPPIGPLYTLAPKNQYRYYAFIDYLKDKGVVVEITGDDTVIRGGIPFTLFKEEEMLNMVRSFTFVK